MLIVGLEHGQLQLEQAVGAALKQASAAPGCSPAVWGLYAQYYRYSSPSCAMPAAAYMAPLLILLHGTMIWSKTGMRTLKWHGGSTATMSSAVR